VAEQFAKLCHTATLHCQRPHSESHNDILPSARIRHRRRFWLLLIRSTGRPQSAGSRGPVAAVRPMSIGRTPTTLRTGHRA
jgi:hypothetical protein